MFQVCYMYNQFLKFIYDQISLDWFVCFGHVLIAISAAKYQVLKFYKSCCVVCDVMFGVSSLLHVLCDRTTRRSSERSPRASRRRHCLPGASLSSTSGLSARTCMYALHYTHSCALFHYSNSSSLLYCQSKSHINSFYLKEVRASPLFLKLHVLAGEYSSRFQVKNYFDTY